MTSALSREDTHVLTREGEGDWLGRLDFPRSSFAKGRGSLVPTEPTALPTPSPTNTFNAVHGSLLLCSAALEACPCLAGHLGPPLPPQPRSVHTPACWWGTQEGHSAALPSSQGAPSQAQGGPRQNSATSGPHCCSGTGWPQDGSRIKTVKRDF